MRAADGCPHKDEASVKTAGDADFSCLEGGLVLPQSATGPWPRDPHRGTVLLGAGKHVET